MHKSEKKREDIGDIGEYVMSSSIVEVSKASDVSMADEWFEKATAEHFWMDWRFRVFRAHVKELFSTAPKCLEIGSGNGVFRSQVEDFFGHGVDGCDLNRQALEMSPQGLGQLYLYDIYERNSRFESFYDFIFLMDVVEHIEDDLSFLKAAMFHLKKGGSVVINVPAIPSLFSAYDTVAGHQRRYSREMLVKLIEDAGLSVRKIIPWGLSMIPILYLRQFLLRKTDPSRVIEKGFVPPNTCVATVLTGLKLLETSCLRHPPAGTSLMIIADS